MGGRVDGYRWRKRRCFEPGNAQNQFRKKSLYPNILALPPYSEKRRQIVTRSLKDPNGLSDAGRSELALPAIRFSSLLFHHQRETRTCQNHPRFSATPTSPANPEVCPQTLHKVLLNARPRARSSSTPPNSNPFHRHHISTTTSLPPQDLSANNVGSNK